MGLLGDDQHRGLLEDLVAYGDELPTCATAAASALDQIIQRSTHGAACRDAWDDEDLDEEEDAYLPELA